MTGAATLRTAEEVRARKFTLVDEEGKTRASLHVGPMSLAGLQLFDRNGKTGAFLFTWPEGGVALYMLDPKLAERINISVGDYGSAALRVKSLDGGRETYWKAP